MESINKKLQSIQLELKVGKSQRNNFGKYNYRSAEDILEALKPLQKKHNVLFKITEELKEVGGVVFVDSLATIQDLDSQESVWSTASAIVDFEAKGMQMPQRTGAASSYAKKYALGNLLLIDDTKDSDATNDHSKTSEEAKEIKFGTPAFKAAKQRIKQGKTSVEQLKKKYKISDKVAEQLND